MNNDLISRVAIKSEIERIRASTKTLTGIDFLWMIETFHAVDAAPVVHARWQKVNPFTDTEECSNCCYNIPSEELETPYCPWCGAKMEGGENDGKS